MVAWVTGGMNPPIDRTATVDVVWAVVSDKRTALITTEVEAPRLLAEYAPASHEMEVLTVPWWDPEAFLQAASEYLGTSCADLGSDGHPAFAHDLTVPLTQARLALSEPEQEQMRSLGRDASGAVQDALWAWRPGDRDRDVAASIAAAVERVGAQAPVLLVGGDERVRHFRHPVAVGDRLHNLVMAVLVASRNGLHVALTRYACAGGIGAELTAGLAATRRIHRRLLAASSPGETIRSVMTELEAAYAAENAEGHWRQHYQGGPIGYAQREFEIAPTQTTSPWIDITLPVGCAVAWNPSVSGGAKDEDTYLTATETPEPITMTTDWPLADEQLPARPGVLVDAA
jgi:antitoxin VapB